MRAVGYKHILQDAKNHVSLDRRQAILEAASHLFEQRGYYGTSLRMIARAAKITPSLLQKYFPTKEAIIAAFVERAMDDLDAFMVAMRAQIVATNDSRLLLYSVGRLYIDFLNHMRGFYLTWIMCPELVEPYRETLPHFITAGHRSLADGLRKLTGISLEGAFLRVRILFGALFATVIYYDRLGFPGTRQEAEGQRLDRVVETVLAPGGEAPMLL